MKYPGLVETPRIAPAAPACQPSGSSAIFQNSHIVSVAGCQTTMCLSEPAAGRAPTGIGTVAIACWRLAAAADLSSVTLTVGCAGPTA